MYIKRTVRAGRIVEIEKYSSARYGHRGGHRAANSQPTPAGQAAANARRATARLRWLLNENFTDGDLHAVLTYRPGDRPDEADARQHMEKLLRILRKTARQSGTVLRYVHTTEYRNAAIHHHMILSGVTLEQLRQAWTHGGVHVTPLYGGDYAALAAYLIKETAKTFREGRKDGEGAAPYGKRWCASRNLRKPKIRVEVVPAESWTEHPRPLKGYQIVPDSVETGTNEENGLPWTRYRMRRIE